MGQTAGFAAGSWIARQAAHTTCSGSHLDIIVTHAGLQSLRFYWLAEQLLQRRPMPKYSKPSSCRFCGSYWLRPSKMIGCFIRCFMA